MLASRIDSATRQPIARIGRGGMAEVILAANKAAGTTKLVVLKRIWPDLAANPDFAAMFLDEARLSARMNHPNVVQVYEVAGNAGRPTITMEYLHGQSLARLISRVGGPSSLPLALRLRIVMDILAGLDYAHKLTDYDGSPLGVVHRDVSPQNVLITYDGHVKLVDFGIARVLAPPSSARAGFVAGKPAYMAPDGLQGRPIDHRADIFSVGVILWELLAGRRMWSAGAEQTILRRLSAGLTIPDLNTEADVSSELSAICRRALEMDPDDRFPTAAAMEAALEQALPDKVDNHHRKLATIMSFAFRRERETRERLIESHVSRDWWEGAPPVVGDLPFDGDEGGDEEQTRERLSEALEDKPVLPPPATPRAVRMTIDVRRWIAPVGIGLVVIAAVCAAPWRPDAPPGIPQAKAQMSRGPSARGDALRADTDRRRTAEPREDWTSGQSPGSGPILVPVTSSAERRALGSAAAPDVEVRAGALDAPTSSEEIDRTGKPRRTRTKRRPSQEAALFALSESGGGQSERPRSRAIDGLANGNDDDGEIAPPLPRVRTIDTTDPFGP